MNLYMLFAGIKAETIICIIFAVIIISLFFVNYFICEKIDIKFIEEETLFWINNIFLLILLFLLIFGMVVFLIGAIIITLLYVLIVTISCRRNKKTKLNTPSEDAQKYFGQQNNGNNQNNIKNKNIIKDKKPTDNNENDII